MKRVFLLIICSLVAAGGLVAQVPMATRIRIAKAEDSRTYDVVLEKLMVSPSDAVRERAALAAGRIGDKSAVPALVKLIEDDRSVRVRTMAAFALGEIESIDGAAAVLKAIQERSQAESVRARAVEAAGKIAAANAKEETAKTLGAAIIAQMAKDGKRASTLRVRLGLTALLRARPDGAEDAVRAFLASPDPAVVADALNALARLRSKKANKEVRDILLSSNPDPVVRANAARVLGAAADADALERLIKSAVHDNDARVRVSAIRALAALKDAKAAAPLLRRGEALLAEAKRPSAGRPSVQSEFIEIAVALGKLLEKTKDVRAVKLLGEYGEIDKGLSPEIYIARLHIAPGRGDGRATHLATWHQISTLAQLVGEFADIEPTSDEARKMKAEAPDTLRPLVMAYVGSLAAEDRKTLLAAPDVLRAYARFKTDDLRSIALEYLGAGDVFMRAAAADILTDLAAERGTISLLDKAFRKALATDKHDNDAQLAILGAMAKIDAAASVDTFYAALDAPDYLVRKRAFELLGDPELLRKYPGAELVVRNAAAQGKDRVLQYDPKTGTKLGQVLNTNADYRRALARRNGSVRAVVTTRKGSFTIDLLPEDAPLTVDDFIKLARANYFNGLEVHRVVPNFVMQDGDPRGDGNGGPGWSIRCEVNMVPYERGAVGMALSGKDTGGSQWFVTHSPQPHLDGGYTVFGKVSEAGMKVVDKIVRGDKIISIRVIGTAQ